MAIHLLHVRVQPVGHACVMRAIHRWTAGPTVSSGEVRINHPSSVRLFFLWLILMLIGYKKKTLFYSWLILLDKLCE
jgi:hypothetical protein